MGSLAGKDLLIVLVKHAMTIGTVIVTIMVLTGCSHHSTTSANSASSHAIVTVYRPATPMFPECGGITDDQMTSITQISGLVPTAKNSVGCQWLARGDLMGPHFSFSWYRGSPIGRERKTELVSRNSVEDITLMGHHGFIAMGFDHNLGNNLCEVGIQFDNDFIEWSINFVQKPFPSPCDIAKKLATQSIENAR